MDASMQAVIATIHASPTRAVLHLAGGASQAIGWLLSVPRASETVLEASIPYSRISMIQLLKKTPRKYVSRETAEDIAIAAYNRSLQLSVPGTVVAGIGFTGTLISSIPKRGDHRCYICARTKDCMWNYKFTFTKGIRNRAQEDFVASQLLIKVLALASGVNESLNPEIHENESLEESVTYFDQNEQIRLLLQGTIQMLPFTYGPGASNNDDERKVVLSGSFNPLHEGHLKLMDAACKAVPGVPIFEISVINADKPPLSVEEIESRLPQFEKEGKTVAFTNQPFFYKKAELFPNSTFVIGTDTAVRLIDPKYYDGSYSKMIEVLSNIQQLGCDFLVAGRKIGETFTVLSDLSIPIELEGLFISLPAEDFRVDISSTEIRKQRENKSISNHHL